MELVGPLKDVLRGKPIISPVVAMERVGEEFAYSPSNVGGRELSASEVVVISLGSDKVVAAFQTVPASTLTDFKRRPECDVPIAGDDPHSVELVEGLVRDVDGSRSLYVGSFGGL